MQEWTNPQKMNAYQLAQPARKIMTYTILCFSMAGLIFGFATGGFWGRAPHPAVTTGSKTTPTTVAHAPSPTATVTQAPKDVVLNPAIVTHISSSEKADGTTSYTFSAQAVYKNPKDKPIDVPDVTCRLWLVQDNKAADAALTGPTKDYTVLRNINNLNQPLPGEVVGAMTFTPSNQVQPCNANGSTTWTYTLTPGIPPGTYYIYILTDWKGRHFPWYESQIQITA